MDLSNENYNNLIYKLDEFIRKFYLNKIVRGTLYLSALFFLSFLAVTIAEYYGNFNPTVRTFLFYLFIALNLFILIVWIGIPLSSYYKLGKRINYKKAAEIIGNHFNPVKDKLLNILQLKQLADHTLQNDGLILAGIDQKIIEIKLVPFTSAINLNENRKYLKYVLPPLLVILLIAFTSPAIFSESTERLFKHDKKFVKKAPFSFLLLNKSLAVVEGEDLQLRLKLSGNEIPKEVYIEDGINVFKTEKENLINFSHTFKNLHRDKKIQFTAGEFSSEVYTINVLKKPGLLNTSVYLKFPRYLKKPDKQLNNPSDITIPAGTIIEWQIKTQNATELKLESDNRTINISPSSTGTFTYNTRADKSFEYKIYPINNRVKTTEPATYPVKVIPDLTPSIQIKENTDSVTRKQRYFIGSISDDYGFSNLTFHYSVLRRGKLVKSDKQGIVIDKETTQASFLHAWDIRSAKLKPGDELQYYFEVFDNDAFSGPKSARTPINTLSLPDEKQLEETVEKSSSSVKKKMGEAIKKSGQIERNAKRLNQELYDKKNLDFQDKKQIEQLLEKQKALENLVDQIKKENHQKQATEEDLNRQNEALRQKQKQIEDLFNNVLDEKTRELLKNIQKLLEQNNKDLTQQQLKDLQLDNKSVKKELDRILELYKQLEFDQKLSETVDKLNQMGAEEKRLAEQSGENKVNTDKLKENQQKLNADFMEIKQALKQLKDKNDELEDKNNFESPEQEQQQIEQQLEQSLKNLDNNNRKKAKENQEKGAGQMKQLAQKLQSMQNRQEQEENKVNMQSLKEILKNLITSSFEQEKVMQQVKTARPGDQNLPALAVKQKNIKDNLKSVSDSLFSLSKRVPQIQSSVNKETEIINNNIVDALTNLADKKIPEANRNQQYAMTSLNNLALMLSEVMDQLQQAMQKGQQGGKGNKKSLSQLREMQEQLNKNMDKARQEMQQNGQKFKQQGKGSVSEKFAKLAKEQQQIRERLQEIDREFNKDGIGKLGNLDKLAGEMEQTETELVNKRIRQETVLRQQEILTKLLDAEKAERERDLDSKRESKQGADKSPNYKLVLEQFKKVRQKELELLKTVPANLNSFYKIKVADYFKLLNSNN